MRRLNDMESARASAAAMSTSIWPMIGVILVGVSRIYAIRAESDHILNQDWAASAAISAAAEATRILTLIIQKDLTHRVEGYARIDRIKIDIDDQLDALEKLDATPAARAQIERVKRARAAYYDSFIAVADMIEAESREDAEKKMNSMALPALDRLQEEIRRLGELQQSQVMENAARARADINFSLMLISLMGAAAVLVGVGFGLSARSITRPLEAAIAIAKRVGQGPQFRDRGAGPCRTKRASCCRRSS